MYENATMKPITYMLILKSNKTQKDGSEGENVYHTNVIIWAQSPDLMLE